MTFYKFIILKDKKRSESTDSHEGTALGPEESILINPQHIVSIKPIRVVLKENLFEGYWLRLSNGKKYRAIDIPMELKKMLDENSESTGKKVSKLDDGQALFIQ